ncbi:MAG: hypothetical protein JO003_04885 [Candidatus Eremiobacteraeota bacterium]|nr:hypothetical protein [Candidatus Eremiobacteraeota bacterium]
MITLRLDHVLNVAICTLLFAGCSGQIGTPVVPAGLTVGQSARGAPPPRNAAFSLKDEVLSGTYSGMCSHSKFEFVANGRAIGPVKGTFLAYGSWKVGPNEWQFQERFKIKSRTERLDGSVLGTEAGGRSTCAAFRDKPLFYFAHHEEGRMRSAIGHDHFSRVFLEQFEAGVRIGARLESE